MIVNIAMQILGLNFIPNSNIVKSFVKFWTTTLSMTLIYLVFTNFVWAGKVIEHIKCGKIVLHLVVCSTCCSA